MATQIHRLLTSQTVSVDTSVDDTEEIPYGNYSGGQVHVPNGSSLTTLTWHTSHEVGGTYEPAFDSTDTAVTTAVAADEAHPIPVALFGAAAIKAVGNAAGTIHVSLKG